MVQLRDFLIGHANRDESFQAAIFVQHPHGGVARAGLLGSGDTNPV